MIGGMVSGTHTCDELGSGSGLDNHSSWSWPCLEADRMMRMETLAWLFQDPLFDQTNSSAASGSLRMAHHHLALAVLISLCLTTPSKFDRLRLNYYCVKCTVIFRKETCKHE